MTGWRGWLVAAGLAGLWASSASAQISMVRESSFAYEPGSGVLTQEVIEPNTPALRLQTDYALDAYGNRTDVTVSGADIATRSSATVYDARGQFPTTNTNALDCPGKSGELLID